MAEHNLTFAPLPKTWKFIDLTGKTYGRWNVLGFAGNRPIPSSKYGIGHWWCECQCGTIKQVSGTQLRSGESTSCRCLQRGSPSPRRTHNEAHNRTAEYTAWSQILGRCHCPTNAAYRNYGARGIQVCDRWRNSFENFLADMGRKPTKSYTLGRIKNDLGYSPDNCRWETRVEQGNNHRGNVRITFDGKTMTIAEWARELGLGYAALYARLHKGMPIERALSPIKYHWKRS